MITHYVHCLLYTILLHVTHAIVDEFLVSECSIHNVYVYELSILVCRQVLECFKRRELLKWSEFQLKYEEVLREGLPDCPATEVFISDTELGKQQWEDLRKRVIEHVSSKYNNILSCTLKFISQVQVHIWLLLL